ncbi:hypothetical protein [Nitrosophilus labii]|uniref:hypothetical protein n=1 Tax=Nitrosophilus labii TaxID=2706014 RepID=UPI0016570CF7|nr:hypothetical protein [Nitrosophilus labii]
MKFRMFDESYIENIKKYTNYTGTSFAVIGAVGIIVNILLPKIPIVLFGGVLLFSAGLVSVYFSYAIFKKITLTILQPFILLISGSAFLFMPLKNDLFILIIILFYLFLDGFIKSAISMALRPLSSWKYLSYSGLFSILMAFSILLGWEFTTKWLLAIILSINIFFDGIMLLRFSKKII